MNDGVGGLAVARGQKKHYQLFANGGSLYILCPCLVL
jgi:hypothetical protein